MNSKPSTNKKSTTTRKRTRQDLKDQEHKDNLLNHDGDGNDDLCEKESTIIIGSIKKEVNVSHSKRRKSTTKKSSHRSKSSPHISKTAKSDGNRTKPRVRKSAKAAKIYQKGKFNTLVTIVSQSKCLDGQEKVLFTDCCVQCSNRNAIRAARTQNLSLMLKCIEAVNDISNLYTSWIKDYPANALRYALINNNREMITALVFNELNPNKKSRCLIKTPKIALSESGENSQYMVGVKTRKLNTTRGNKMGNNALLMDDPDDSTNMQMLNISEIVMTECNDPSIIDFIKSIFINTQGNTYYYLRFEDYISKAAQRGNRTMAAYMIKQAYTNSLNGFNALHSDVLNLETPDLQIKIKTSLTKKPQTNDGMTPMHLVCINPDTRYIDKMIELGADWNVLDSNNRKPLHYAAACEEVGPLSYLLSKGALIDEGDKSKKTALMVACESGREENVKLLIEKGANVSLKLWRPTNSAIHMATINGHINIVKLLIQTNKLDIDMPGQDRMTPLMIAAFYGYNDLVTYLLEMGAKVIKKDKFRRTALLHSCRSGQTVIASILLAKGSEYMLGDSSKNSPMHYACAYGWIEIVELLIQANANPNDENMWRITPMEIAFLKNHFHIVKYLLDTGKSNVDTKFNRDMTLLHYAFSKITPESLHEIRYLIYDKKADINLQNYDGDTCFHYLAKFSYSKFKEMNAEIINTANEDMSYEEKEIINKGRHRDLLKKIFKLLNTKELQKEIVNNEGRSALHLAFEVRNIPFVEEIAEMNLKLTFRDKNGNTLLHLIPKYVFGSFEERRIVLSILQKAKLIDENELDNISNAYDNNGFPPFLKLMHDYSSHILEKENSIYRDVKYEMQKSIYANKNRIRSASSGMNNKIEIDEGDNDDKEKEQQDDELHTEGEEEEEEEEESIDDNNKLNKYKSFNKVNAKSQKMICLPFNNSSFPTNNKCNQKATEAQIRSMTLSPKDELQVLKETKKQFESFLHFFQNIIEGYIELKCNPLNKVGKKAEYRIAITEKKKEGTVNKSLSKNQRIEMQYHNKHGKKTSLMFLMSFPNEKLLNYFINELKLEVNEINLYKENALFFLISEMKTHTRLKDYYPTVYSNALSILLSKQINVNQCDCRDNTPFYLLSKHWDTKMMEMLLNNKADVNKFNKSDENALLYYVRAKSYEKSKVLIEEFNCDINFLNAKKRSIMHYLFNDEIASTNTDDSLTDYLLGLKPHINVQDISGRTPLHYLFIKIGKEYATDVIDPINSLTKLIEYEDIDLEPVDYYGNTPLHYAAQRGSTISLLTLLSKSVCIDKTNTEGNTALNYAIMFNQPNIAILLIQQHADINLCVFELKRRDEGERVKKLKEQLNKSINRNNTITQIMKNDLNLSLNTSMDLNSSMNIELDFTIKNNQGIRVDNTNIIDEEKEEELTIDENDNERNDKTNNSIDKDDEDEDINDDDSYSSDADSDNSKYKNKNLKTISNNPFQAPVPKASRFSRMTSHNKYRHHNIATHASDQLNERFFTKPKDKAGISLFRIVIRQNFQGLTYLFLSSGYDLMKSIEDSFYEGIFNLAMQLLKRSNKPEIYTVENGRHQNLFHILGKISYQRNQNDLKPFFNMLSSKGISVEKQDDKGNTPLHYASKNHFYDLCKHILSTKNQSKLLSITNKKSRTPFVLSIIKDNIKTANNFYQLLFDKKTASMKYMDDSYEQNYQLTPLIHVVRKYLLEINTDSEINAFLSLCDKIILQLINNGASVMEKDSKGLDCLMYCVINNNLRLLKQLLTQSKPESIQFNALDSKNKTLIHYCTSLNEEGSYENEEMLRYLIEKGFATSLPDWYGLTPVNYASKQISGNNLSVFKSYNIDNSTSISVLNNKREEEATFNQIVDYEKDSETFFSIKEMELLKEPRKIKPNLMDYQEDLFELYRDDTYGYWNASCTKVNIQNGVYGEYMFYFIQLIHDKGKKMYIVTTQFGRIGEEGANQRSPFNTLEEAQTDFKKIFKQKTGNVWENKQSFEKQKGKYMLLQFDEVQLNHKELLQPIDYAQCPQSTISNKEIIELMKEITDSSIYFKALRESGIDTDTFKFSMLNKTLILKAKDIMLNIVKNLNLLDNIKKDKDKQGFNAVYQQNEIEQITNIWNSIYVLSSSYYELIPKKRFANSIIQPFGTLNDAKAELMMLNNLSYVEKAVNILLGAQFKQSSMNPLDYIYNSLNIHIDTIDKASIEFNMIKQYIENTKTRGQITNLFKLNRKGETDSMKQWYHVNNHFLLFHGTKVFNFIGIFSNGLKIAPPEAPVTGYMFGKGLYFADMFSKSICYCDEVYNKDTGRSRSYMLICEVALGNSFSSYFGEDPELSFLNKGYHSLRSRSMNIVDHKMNFVLNNGVILPLGRVIKNINESLSDNKYNNTTRQYPTQDTEYVVYDTSQVKLRYLVQIED